MTDLWVAGIIGVAFLVLWTVGFTLAGGWRRKLWFMHRPPKPAPSPCCCTTTPWHMIYFCVKCDLGSHWEDVESSGGVCPWCGAIKTHGGDLLTDYTRKARRLNKGVEEYKPELNKNEIKAWRKLYGQEE